MGSGDTVCAVPMNPRICIRAATSAMMRRSSTRIAIRMLQRGQRLWQCPQYLAHSAHSHIARGRLGGRLARPSQRCARPLLAPIIREENLQQVVHDVHVTERGSRHHGALWWAIGSSLATMRAAPLAPIVRGENLQHDVRDVHVTERGSHHRGAL